MAGTGAGAAAEDISDKKGLRRGLRQKIPRRRRWNPQLADLTDSLLLQIIALLSSFHDLLALIGTCRSWRAALSSLPPAFSFNFPPLHLQADDYDRHPHHNYFKLSLLSSIKWQLVNPAKKMSSRRCSVPQNIRVRMRFFGCSYGYLIFFNMEECLLVDVYSGAIVKPPKLKSTGNDDIYCGILAAPFNSSNSHLLFCSKSSMFLWQVGSNSWSEHPLDVQDILQIVLFKGEMIAMDLLGRFHRMRLVPQLSVQQVAVMWEDMVLGQSYKQWRRLLASGIRQERDAQVTPALPWQAAAAAIPDNKHGRCFRLRHQKNHHRWNPPTSGSLPLASIFPSPSRPLPATARFLPLAAASLLPPPPVLRALCGCFCLCRCLSLPSERQQQAGSIRQPRTSRASPGAEKLLLPPATNEEELDVNRRRLEPAKLNGTTSRRHVCLR
nr:unnamed protein product [Digitaria exilis]